jgi:hypothetical protein
MYTVEQKQKYPESYSFFLPSGEEHSYIYKICEEVPPLGLVFLSEELMSVLLKEGLTEKTSENGVKEFYLHEEFFGNSCSEGEDYMLLALWGQECLEQRPFMPSPGQLNKWFGLGNV